MSEILALALAAASDAAGYVNDRRASVGELIFDRKEGAKNAAADLVSDVDRVVEERIRTVITSARPGDGFLGEEGVERASSSGLRWVIDPIDGTLNFAYGRHGFAISIACEDGSGTLAGVVVDPVCGAVYAAERGHGAWRDGTPLRVRPTTELEECLLDMGRGRGMIRERFPDVVRALDPHVRDIRRVGSAALALCGLASGQLDAVYGPGLEPWDMAAGLLIAEEAGAVVGNLSGGMPDSTVMLAASPALFTPLCRIIAPVLDGVLR